MIGIKDSLGKIDWQTNVQTSLDSDNTFTKIDEAAKRVAVWSRQLEERDEGNPALSFVREMQHSLHHSSALIGLCLYKPSAASSRTLVESCIYYSYFRTHSEELSTLVRDKNYYLSKSDIISYHKIHTLEFNSRQNVLGVIGRLETWYSTTSAVVHGQLPGAWNTHATLSETSYKKNVHDLAVETLLEGVAIANDFLFSTIAQSLWDDFAPEAKTFLVKGMPKDKREALKLDRK